MPVGRVAELHHETLARRSEVSQSPIHLVGLLAHLEVDAELLVFVLFFPVVMLFALLLVVTVEFAGERNSVSGVIGTHAEADESPIAEPA